MDRAATTALKERSQAGTREIKLSGMWGSRLRRREAFNGVNAIMGYHPIDIVSPPEVFDE